MDHNLIGSNSIAFITCQVGNGETKDKRIIFYRTFFKTTGCRRSRKNKCDPGGRMIRWDAMTETLWRGITACHSGGKTVPTAVRLQPRFRYEPGQPKRRRGRYGCGLSGRGSARRLPAQPPDQFVRALAALRRTMHDRSPKADVNAGTATGVLAPSCRRESIAARRILGSECLRSSIIIEVSRWLCTIRDKLHVFRCHRNRRRMSLTYRSGKATDVRLNSDSELQFDWNHGALSSANLCGATAAATCSGDSYGRYKARITN